MFGFSKSRDNKGRFAKGHKFIGKGWPKGKKRGSKDDYCAPKILDQYLIDKACNPPTNSTHNVDTNSKPFIKLFGIGDTHWSKENNKMINIEPTLKFLKYWGPIDVLVFGGDIWDLSYLSHWNKDKFDDIGHQRIAELLQQESMSIQNLLKQFINASGAKRIVYIIGNHEDWEPQYLDKYDKVHSHLGKNNISAWLNFKELNIEEVPLHETFTIGHMTFKHGETYGTQNPAKQAIERSHRSMFFWHHHKFIAWPGYTDVDENEKIQSYAIPGFCKANEMSYMKKAANNWSNGFLLSYIKPSGHFTPHVQVVSPSGNFIYNDKEFE